MTNETPNIIPHSKLFDVLQSDPRPSVIVPFPRYDANGNPKVNVRIRVLLQADHDRIQAKAALETDQALSKSGEKVDRDSIMWQDIYANKSASLLIFEFCRDPENETLPFFPTVKEMEKMLLPGEVEVLVLNYKRLKTQAGPVIVNMDAEEMKKYISTLASSAEASPYFLDRFGFVEQAQFMIFMAQEVQRLQMLNSSVGSLSNNLPQNTLTSQ